MVQLIHIAPELPPTVGGVADYTAILSKRIVEVTNRAVEPILIHAGKEAVNAIDVAHPVEDLGGQCSSNDLSGVIARLHRESDIPAMVLLEYSGYGYSGRGAPFWLVQGLRRGCNRRGIPLVTIFHELYANSYKPWEAQFWAMPVQRYVATELASISDGLMANWDAAAQWLKRQVDGQTVRMSPTFSNVGEPMENREYKDRQPYAVCFGGAAKKNELFEESGIALTNILQKEGVDRIVDIGPSSSKYARAQIGLPVEEKGILSGEAVSSFLRDASLGLLNYPLHCLKKSGVWASYAAHGVPTLLAAKEQDIEGLENGRHYLLLDEQRLDADNLDEISKAAYEWYWKEARSQRAAQRVLAFVSELV
jgi:hypothetical protein